jgi:hypothetical protein
MTPDNMAQVADDLLGRHHGEIHLDLDTHHHEGQNVSDSDAHGGQAALFSRQDLPQCCNVVAGPMGGAYLGPGTYQATFRLKVPDNLAGEDVARVAVRWLGAGVLAEKTLAPDDFSQAGEYENVQLHFTLDRFATAVQVEMDYYGGMPGKADMDLYADDVHLLPQGEPAMPVFAAIQLMWSGPEMMNLPGQFTTRFESGGGVVLHPDEFLASLNPEFMIEWAEPVLGLGHTALAEAQDHLDAGRFLDSLYVVRQALKVSRE